MRLNKRAGLLMLPVILAAYITAAISVFQLQRKTVEKAELSQLSHNMAELKTIHDNHSRFASNYLFTLLKGNVLKGYLNEQNDYLRARTLGISLEEALYGLLPDQSGFASITLIQPNQQVMFYYENSEDPFADISPEHKSVAIQTLNSGQSRNQKLILNQDNALLLYTLIIDRETMLQPVDFSAPGTLALQMALEAVELNSRISAIEKRYMARVGISASAPERSFSHAVALTPEITVSMTIPKAYFDSLLQPFKQQLMLAITGLSAATLLILSLLIRRFITQPIAKLDQQLAAVMEKRLDNIANSEGDDEISHLAGSFHKLYQRLSDAHEITRRLSLTDSLTTLPNRSSFTQQLTAALESNPQAQLALLFIDLDNFKFVNDRFGHEAGDSLLRSFAHRTQSLLRHRDSDERSPDDIFFSRLSGDEFAILIRNIRQPQTAPEIARRIIEQFDNGFKVERIKYPVSASIGIALYPRDAGNASQLISNADAAMYQAKSEGKNRYSIYSEKLTQKARQLKEIEQQLRSIVFDQEFHLVFMPTLNRDAEVSHCEALLRWNSPSLGNVPPDLFIPIAESTGSFAHIDKWVLNQALAAYPSLQRRFGEQLTLSINLSAAELENPQLEQMLLDALARHPVDSRHIELEITETFNAHHSSRHIAVLNRIRAIGFSIVIDDFGTGYTSMLQMVEYPVDKIKLDKTFTGMLTQPRQRKLLKPIIDLCHSQQICVTAEGIETRQQQQLLMEAGCDYFQGYLICKPERLERLPQEIPDNVVRVLSV